MLLIVILNDGTAYGDRRELRVPGVDRTEIQDGHLVAIRTGDVKARINMTDVRNYHLEED